MSVLEHLPPALQGRCRVLPRYTWMSQETSDTAEAYKTTLLQSDLTLAPAGLNTECVGAAAGKPP